MNISNAEAIELTGCHTCGARRGEPCVYLLPRAPYPPSMQAKVDRAGTPTKNVHPHRRHDAHDLRRGNPLPPRGAVQIRNELHVLEALATGRWNGWDEHPYDLSDPAIMRCDDAGWIDYGHTVRITEAGRARLEEGQ